MPTVLNRNAILSADDIQKELVEVPEWGKDVAVYVRGLTASERDAFESSMVEQRGKKQIVNMANTRAKLASYAICDDQGNRIFTDLDVPKLSKKSAASLQRIFIVAQRLSGMSDGDVEELTKGQEESPFDGSPTASR